MGWVGNIFLIVGLWLVGYKNRKAFIFSVIGETIWVFYALNRGMYDLAFICVVFGALAIRNWYLWGKEDAYWDEMVKAESKKSGKLL